ncbi:MAG: tRNA-dihydrouridine synthase, partial [bacterium]
HLFYDHRFQDGLKRLAEAIKLDDVKAVIQLTIKSNPQPRKDVTDIPIDEVKGFIDALVYAARISFDTGFDGVEPHGAHGFIMNRFFSPISNQRKDEYGGDLYNRMRFGLDVVRNIKSAVGEGFLIFYRHTPVEWQDNGYTLEDSIAFGKELKKVGLDVFDISPSTPSGSYQYGVFAKEIREKVDIPVVAVGKMHVPEIASKMIRENYADLVAIGRALLADPFLPKKLEEGRLSSINVCKQCNIKCHGYLRRGLPISCVNNHSVGREYFEIGFWTKGDNDVY